MSTKQPFRLETEPKQDTDADRVNYWLSYLSDISQEDGEESPADDPSSPQSMEDSRSDSISSNDLGGLGEILLGGSGSSNEFDLLQEILVKPEMIEFRERISQLEKKVNQLENNNQAQEFAEIFLPLISKLLNRKLAKLKQEIVGELSPLIERLIEEQYDQEKNLSIRVIGIQKDVN
jgi:hypothetical protein